MIDIGTITAAISGLQGAFGLANTAISARDQAQLAEAQKAMNSRIIEIQTTCMQLLQDKLEGVQEASALKDRVRALEAQVVDLERTKAERKRYVLSEMGGGTGLWAYRYVPAAEDTTPAHWACQPCFESGRKTVLQRTVVWGASQYDCVTCKASMTLALAADPAQR